MDVSMRRILCATDFSPPAQQAQNYACALADKFWAELHVLHVVGEPLPLPGPKGSWLLPAAILPNLIQKAELELAANTEAIRLTTGSRAVCTVKVGHPVEQVLKYVKDNEIDLIVVGTQGHTGLSRLLLGSVAEKIVRLATGPVLTVHPQDHSFLMDASAES